MGDPPLVGVAVKVTFVPEQIVLPGAAAMLTDGDTTEFTVIVIALDVTGLGLAQVIDEVITQVTISPFTNVEFW